MIFSGANSDSSGNIGMEYGMALFGRLCHIPYHFYVENKWIEQNNKYYQK